MTSYLTSTGTSLVQHLMTILIREHDRFYSGRDQEGSGGPQPEGPAPGHQLQHRSLGAWISEEDLQSGPAANGDRELHSSASSLDAKPCAAVAPGAQTPKLGSPSGRGETVVSPSKHAKTAPSWKYSFKSSSAPRAQAQGKPGGGGGTGSGSVADAASVSSGNWLMNGLSSLRGHRRTSSGERSARDRDSTGSSQRLSTYDNVTSSCSMGSVPSGAGAPWSASSCEISVPDSGGGEWAGSQRELGDDGGATTDPSSEQDSCEAMELCGSSAACSDDGNAAAAPAVVTSEDGDGAAALGGLEEELKDELRKQKVSYETRIQR